MQDWFETRSLPKFAVCGPGGTGRSTQIRTFATARAAEEMSQNSLHLVAKQYYLQAGLYYLRVHANKMAVDLGLLPSFKVETTKKPGTDPPHSRIFCLSVLLSPPPDPPLLSRCFSLPRSLFFSLAHSFLRVRSFSFSRSLSLSLSLSPLSFYPPPTFSLSLSPSFSFPGSLTLATLVVSLPPSYTPTLQ